MDDSWSFRTERGLAWVADGDLRVERSARGLLRKPYRKKWTRASTARKGLFVFSTLTSAATFSRLVPAFVGSGPVTEIQWFLSGCLCLLVSGFAWKATRSKTIPLAEIESAERTNRTLRLTRDGDESEPVEVRARTDADAEAAAETLRLKGVAVETASE